MKHLFKNQIKNDINADNIFPCEFNKSFNVDFNTWIK